MEYFFRDQTLGATVIFRNKPHMEQGLIAAMKRAPSDLPALLWFLPGFVKRRIVDRPNLIKILDTYGLFFDKVLRMGVGLIVGAWVARYLGPTQQILNYAQAFVALFTTFAGLGLQGIVVRDIVRDPSCVDITLGTTAMMQFVVGAW